MANAAVDNFLDEIHRKQEALKVRVRAQTRISLKRFKHMPRMSEETQCFVADICLDGVVVGSTRNEGRGGCTLVDCRHAELVALCTAFAPRDPADEFGDDPTTSVIDALVYLELDQKEYRRMCRGKLVFQLTTSQPREYCSRKTPYTPELAAALRVEYGERLVRILNEELI